VREEKSCVRSCCDRLSSEANAEDVRKRLLKMQVPQRPRAGDATNVVLPAVGRNFRRILAWLRVLWPLILAALIEPIRVQ
jgi:hypothetical protein